ncbi:MAG: glycoside hydrolase family 32 protein [Roseiflexaceae bacterium]|nr:glycoside hydrolase family 32 protein [Roseiflexaceae bacterium]
MTASRPHFHFTPAAGWMNDPNGLVYFDGEYHLFFQYRKPRHWGHAVSRDLVQWQELPVALEPNALGEMWSGSAVVDWHNTSGLFDDRPGLAALVTQRTHGAQVQSLASSQDAGRTWTMYANNPVLANPDHLDFRDPKVFWHEPSGRWLMVLAAGDCVQFYTSPDLREWTFRSDFRADLGTRTGVWECPDLVELPIDGGAGSAWVLHLSTSGAIGSLMHYFVGTFDGTHFSAATTGVTDYGEDFYAAVTWLGRPAGDQRVLWIGWMNNWRYGYHVATTPWQGAMTIPRELGLARTPAGLRLTQRPARELAQRRGTAFRLENALIAGSPTLELRGQALEIIAELHAGDANSFGLRVRVGLEQHTTIGYDLTSGELFLDRRASGQSPHATFPARHAAPLALDDGRLRLHIFVDTCSVEVFAGAGTVVLTDLIFPDDTAVGVEVFAEGGAAELLMLEAYQL